MKNNLRVVGGTFALFMFLAGVVTTAVCGVVLALVAVVSGVGLTNALPAGVVVGISTLQFGLLLVSCWVAASWLARKKPGHQIGSFGLRPAMVDVLALAALGGVMVGWLPALLAEHLRHILPSLELGSAGIISELLGTPDASARFGILLLVCLVAPITEELVFRGFVFHLFEKGFGWKWGVLVSSISFAAFHVDPIHAIPLLLTGLFLGGLRHLTGSTIPGIIAHVANNLSAVVAAHLALPMGATFAWMTAIVAILIVVVIAQRTQPRNGHAGAPA